MSTSKRADALRYENVPIPSMTRLDIRPLQPLFEVSYFAIRYVLQRFPTIFGREHYFCAPHNPIANIIVLI
jgi:hypothetical protein